MLPFHLYFLSIIPSSPLIPFLLPFLSFNCKVGPIFWNHYSLIYSNGWRTYWTSISATACVVLGAMLYGSKTQGTKYNRSKLSSSLLKKNSPIKFTRFWRQWCHSNPFFTSPYYLAWLRMWGKSPFRFLGLDWENVSWKSLNEFRDRETLFLARCYSMFVSMMIIGLIMSISWSLGRL